MKNFLFGKVGEPSPVNRRGNPNLRRKNAKNLAQEIINNDVILQIIRELPLLTVQVGVCRPELIRRNCNSYVQVVATLASRDHAHFSSEYMVSEKGDEILSYVLEGYCNESI